MQETESPHLLAAASDFASRKAMAGPDAARGFTASAPPSLDRCRNPMRGVFFADELNASQSIQKELCSGRIRNSTSGKHLQDLLLAEYARQTAAYEQVTTIRFPPDYAAMLHRRIRYSLSGGILGLEITPTRGEDYRLFDVEILLYEGDEEFLKRIREAVHCNEADILGHHSETIGIDEQSVDKDGKLREVGKVKLKGILLELPCKIEIYKFLPYDLEDGYKSGDVRQMIYVWDPTRDTLDLTKFRPHKEGGGNENWYSSPSGVTPGTYNIVERKFRKAGIFSREEVATAEHEILCTMYLPHRDIYTLHALSRWDSIKNKATLTYRLDKIETNDVDPLGPDDEPIFDVINSDDCKIFDERPGGGWDSDMDSDSIFGMKHFRERQLKQTREEPIEVKQSAEAVKQAARTRAQVSISTLMEGLGDDTAMDVGQSQVAPNEIVQIQSATPNIADMLQPLTAATKLHTPRLESPPVISAPDTPVEENKDDDSEAEALMLQMIGADD